MPERTTINRLGSVSVGASQNSAWTPKAVGLFYLRADASESSDCEVTARSGPCRLWTCGESAYVTSPSPKLLNVGSVQVSSSTESLELTRDTSGVYRQEEPPAALWQTKDTLTLEIEGSSKFEPITAILRAPLPLTVTAPEAPADTPLVMDATSDLQLAWSAPLTGSVILAISAETVEADGAEPILTPGIDCEFPADAGEGLLPADLLQQLQAPATLSHYYLDAVTYASDFAASGDSWVDFRATWVGLSTPATLQ